MSFTVTVTQSGSSAAGSEAYLVVVTGQAASPIGASVATPSTVPAATLSSPAATGSWVYGANLGLIGTYTPNGSTTYKSNLGGQGLEYVFLRSTGTTTAGTAITLGGTATVNSISTSLLEIKPSTPGSLAENASSPGVFHSTTATTTSAAFTPPAGSLLVLMVATNGASGTVNVGITDTSGLGLTWTEQIALHTTGTGYTGVWTAVMPAGGTAHTVGASLTVTPTFHATAIRGHVRGASLSPVPVLNAGRIHGNVRAASLSPVPVFSAGRTRGHTRAASLSPVPVLNAGRTRGHTRAAFLAVTPVLSAGRTRGHTRAASLSITPVLHAAGFAGGFNTLTLSVTSDINVLSGLTLTATIEVNVGAPIQEGIRSLATDRWYSMYPS